MTRTPRGATADAAFAEHEHAELTLAAGDLHRLACLASEITVGDLARRLRDVENWVATALEPHAAWEESTLYRRIDALAETPWATRLMRFEHRQIREAAREIESDRRRLEVDGADHRLETAGDLFALEALLWAHIQREQLLLLPIVDEGGVEATPARAS
jgi:hemerythrin-like domain-containing protein